MSTGIIILVMELNLHMQKPTHLQMKCQLGLQDLELTDGLNLITANYHKRWKQNLYNPFITAGIGFAVPHVDITVNTKKTYEYQLTGAAARVGGGVSYPINKKYSIFM